MFEGVDCGEGGSRNPPPGPGDTGKWVLREGDRLAGFVFGSVKKEEKGINAVCWRHFVLNRAQLRMQTEMDDSEFRFNVIKKELLPPRVLVVVNRIPQMNKG